MKGIKIIHFLAIVGMIFGFMATAWSHDDVDRHKTCEFCGMDRGNFDFSRMLIEYDDGTVAALCSIHCAAINLANNIDKTPKTIKAGDFKNKQLIDAEKAFWVVGGNKPGVMSKRGKWAFESKEDAKSFIKVNNGHLASFEDAMKASYEDMAIDTKMIREKRKMKRMQKTSEQEGHTAH